MSNPVNSVDLSQSLADFLTAHSALLQQKADKTGGVVPAAGTISRAGAVWGNFVDDFILAWYGNTNPARLEIVTGSTADATPTVIGDALTGVADGSHTRMELHVFGKVAANDFVYRRLVVRAENDGGTVQQDIDVAEVERYSAGGTLSTATATVQVNGTDIEILVTGEAATGINWEVHVSRIVGHSP